MSAGLLNTISVNLNQDVHPSNSSLKNQDSTRSQGFKSNLQIIDSALDCIGATPLVRLDKLAKLHGLKCNLLAKLESYNPGGSIKDRIASRMIIEAEKEGRLLPGKSVIIEPTSGNTGIGLALAAAIKGYRCIIVMPQKMSQEKINMLKALGAKIVRTPTEASFDSPESHLSVAARLEKAIPNAVILNQYNNPFNPQTHYETTGIEIIEAIGNTPSSVNHPSSEIVDLFIAGAGTGGTISGVSRRLKDHYGSERVRSIGVDPIGSILAKPESLNVGGPANYQTEGTGYDFAPEVLDYNLIDEWIKVSDSDSFETLREMIKIEGLLCGGSSGQAVSGALRYLKVGGPGWEKYGNVTGKNVIIICADSIRNYITKDWLIDGAELLETNEEDLICQSNSD
ncbi:hypothetical protein O181_033672 [Austropuccinia psidii MF-1]|uniref:cystathionine beta-synthase n=1 Tax=Austropuccinia psidii MF-1 TaxID=1389203 RepID=A0A9Q3D1U2_9BASI|nr:hypothetical protein [Austropuccinia psidii MF-1]